MKIEALQATMLSIAQMRSVEAVLAHIVEGLRKCSDVALARIWLIEPGKFCPDSFVGPGCTDLTHSLRLVASAGQSKVTGQTYSRTDGTFQRFQLGVRKIGRIAQTGEPLLIPKISFRDEWLANPDWAVREGIQSFAGQPLLFGDKILGVLAVFDRTTFTSDDFAWLRMFADYAAISITNARAFEEIEQLKGQLEDENVYLREEVKEAREFGDIIGKSVALQKVLQQIELVARTDAHVLILGESGTGKELIARAIHERSLRNSKPLIRVNCAAVPEALFESEFFGHVKGAFTGAVRDRIGRFQLADKGTLFLDEVGEIPLSLQSKLLRVLQEQQFERVGEEKTQRVDIRIIAATNKDLQKEVATGTFRQDLFYRLSVFPVEVPPLRARPEDIPLLARHFLKRAAHRIGSSNLNLAKEHVYQLQSYDWPGNVRELQNVIERAVILAQSGPLRFDIGSEPNLTSQREAFKETPLTRDQLRLREKENIQCALAKSGGRIFGSGGAAELLGMKPTTLASRIKALGMKRKSG